MHCGSKKVSNQFNLTCKPRFRLYWIGPRSKKMESSWQELFYANFQPLCKKIVSSFFVEIFDWFLRKGHDDQLTQMTARLKGIPGSPEFLHFCITSTFRCIKIAYRSLFLKSKTFVGSGFLKRGRGEALFSVSAWSSSSTFFEIFKPRRDSNPWWALMF